MSTLSSCSVMVHSQVLLEAPQEGCITCSMVHVFRLAPRSVHHLQRSHPLPNQLVQLAIAHLTHRTTRLHRYWCQPALGDDVPWRVVHHLNGTFYISPAAIPRLANVEASRSGLINGLGKGRRRHWQTGGWACPGAAPGCRRPCAWCLRASWAGEERWHPLVPPACPAAHT